MFLLCSSRNIVNSNVGSSNLKRKRERFDVRLTSILTLRKRLKEVEHKGTFKQCMRKIPLYFLYF